jgi:molecular chaperone DnaK
MVSDADAHAEEDRRKKDEAEARNNADSLLYTTEKTLKDLGDKVPEATKTACEQAAEEVKRALESDDTDAIKAATEKLQEASYKLAEIVYQEAQEATEPSAEAAAPASGEGEEEVVEADYEVVDEDK